MADIVERLRKDKWHVSGVDCETAAQEIERLREQLDSCVSFKKRQSDEWLSWAEKRDALELDAARYRWLRDVADADSGHPYVTIHKTNDCGKWFNTWECGEGLDAAIDAAMKGQ